MEWVGDSGFGYGVGFGGYGYGYSYGSGSGSGCGFGFGFGDEHYWQLAIGAIKMTPKERKRYEAALGRGDTICYWRSDDNGQPSNGGRGMNAAAPGVVHEVEGKISLCANGLHGTLLPPAWQGDTVWIVALSGDVQGSAEKFVGRRREIISRAW